MLERDHVFFFLVWQQYASVKSAIKSRYILIYWVDVIIMVHLLKKRGGQNLCAQIVNPRFVTSGFPYPVFFLPFDPRGL